MTKSHRSAKILIGIAAIFLSVTTQAQAVQKQDYLLGPVTLGLGDTLHVSVVNLDQAGLCEDFAEVTFIEHDSDISPSGAPGSADIAVEQVRTRELGSARIAPGNSARIPLHGAREGSTKSVQVQVATDQLLPIADFCIGVGGTVIRADGSVDPVGPLQSGSDLAGIQTTSEAVCIGHYDCEMLITMCKKAGDECSFTCHLILHVPPFPPCIFGSTD